MGDPKECFKPHTVLHSISGAGFGLIVVSLIPSLVQYSFLLGVLLFFGVMVLEQVLKKKK